MGANVAKVAAAAAGLVGLSAAIASWTVQEFEAQSQGPVIIGSLVGAQVIAPLSITAAVCLTLVGIVVLALTRRIPRGRTAKAWAVAAGVATFIVAAPLALEGAWAGLELVAGTRYTDLGTTRDGVHLFIGESSWFHTNVSVYRQLGWHLTYLSGFGTRPIDPFANHDYELFDHGYNAVLVWHWTESGHGYADSIVIPLS